MWPWRKNERRERRSNDAAGEFEEQSTKSLSLVPRMNPDRP